MNLGGWQLNKIERGFFNIHNTFVFITLKNIDNSMIFKYFNL